MTVVFFVLLAVTLLLAYVWRHAEAENARLREDLDALAPTQRPDADTIMAARLAAHNELRAHGAPMRKP